MCDQCDKLKEKIAHYRIFLDQRFDALTEERIKALIADMRNLLFTLGVGAGFFLAMYQWITMLAGAH